MRHYEASIDKLTHEKLYAESEVRMLRSRLEVTRERV